ncbi:hypothetical protein [Magnetococcus sp. PR-3]|uniref:hypothetical protein n=1 Tax=Magnetococcus sp. PR-3 TaxID=3120355 RepID=UPI002FCE3D5B
MSKKDFEADHEGPEWKKLIFLLGIPLIFLAFNFMRIGMPEQEQMAEHFHENRKAFKGMLKHLGPQPPFSFIAVNKFESTRDRNGDRVAVKPGVYSREIWRNWQSQLQHAGLKALKIRWLEPGKRHVLFYTASYQKLKNAGSFGYLYLEDDLARAEKLFARENIRLYPLEGDWYLFQWHPKGVEGMEGKRRI